MYWSVARRSGHRGRGAGHDAAGESALVEKLSKALLAAAILTLAACATTTREIPPPAPAQAEPSAPAALAPSPSVSDARALMVESATAMLGQPYLFGGTAPGGFDCSGLVAYAAASAGVRMPRTAAEQMEMGTSVARTELQPGDLIFMHLAGKELHVAIALDERRFVHAPSHGGIVRIDLLTSQPYSAGFIDARRVIPAIPSTVSFAAPN
jgi:peptidoglycan DL-endopeptidase CwlO